MTRIGSLLRIGWLVSFPLVLGIVMGQVGLFLTALLVVFIATIITGADLELIFNYMRDEYFFGAGFVVVCALSLSCGLIAEIAWLITLRRTVSKTGLLLRELSVLDWRERKRIVDENNGEKR